MQPTIPRLPEADLAGAAALCRDLMLARPAWRLGAQGPEAFDCWSMLALIEKRLFGREVEIGLPRGTMRRSEILRAFAGEGSAAAMHAQWRRREGKPQHGDGVLMSHKAAPHHCGVFLALDRGVIAHHAEHGGFCVDTPVQLRLAGYADLTFFEWIGDCG